MQKNKQQTIDAMLRKIILITATHLCTITQQVLMLRSRFTNALLLLLVYMPFFFYSGLNQALWLFEFDEAAY